MRATLWIAASGFAHERSHPWRRAEEPTTTKMNLSALSRRTIARGATIAGLCVAIAGVVPAFADDLPPYAGSHDDASYGGMSHTTFAGVPSAANTDDLPPYARSHDDASYGDTSHQTFTAELMHADEKLAGQYDDVTYPTADRRPAEEPQAVASAKQHIEMAPRVGVDTAAPSDLREAQVRASQRDAK